jgi:hypothetical protein
MVTARVLRLAMIRDVQYRAGTELRLTEAHADRLIKLGLVAIVSATPAPTYDNRMMADYERR